jgi:hypothetical protein
LNQINERSWQSRIQICGTQAPIKARYFLIREVTVRFSRSVLREDKFTESQKQKCIRKSLDYNVGAMRALVNEKYDK